jgi:putative redox protein
MVAGGTLIAKSDSGHWTVMDVPEELGGHSGAMGPFEHLLAALAGCTATDVLIVLRKKRIAIDDLRIGLEAHRVDKTPKIADKIHLHFTAVGPDIPPDALERAIELSQEKYCSVSAMLKGVAEITHSYAILTPEEARSKLV